MARLLLLSNGHGEDLSGALLGKVLKKTGHQVDALPLVGHGHAYSEAEIEILGQVREFSTGGLGYTSLRGRLTELLQGQVLYLLQRLGRLLQVAHRYDLLVVIGDVIPVMAAWLSFRPVAIYLVAYSSHYEGRLRLPWPCGRCLTSRRVLGIFSRDELTATDLTSQLQRPVSFLGNPFMDPVLTPQARLPACRCRLGLLPGSRRPELEHNLMLLLALVEYLPEQLLTNGELSLDLALVPALDDNSLAAVITHQGWRMQLDPDNETLTRLVLGERHITLRRDSFIKVLQSSDLLISMAGTATEQAVGLATPVVQLAGMGPQFTAEFAEAQRRLLGPTVFCADGKTGEALNLQNTAKLTVELLKRSLEDRELHAQCQQQAARRLGGAGGGQRLAEAITNLLTVKHQ